MKRQEQLAKLINIFGAIDRDARNGDILKLERTIGKTSITINAIDSEILENLPEDVRRDLEHTPESDGFWSTKLYPGRVQCWVRLNDLGRGFGRWFYYEAQIPPELLKFPKSKSFEAFENMCDVIHAYGISIAPQHKDAIMEQCAMLLNPNTIWRG